MPNYRSSSCFSPLSRRYSAFSRQAPGSEFREGGLADQFLQMVAFPGVLLRTYQQTQPVKDHILELRVCHLVFQSFGHDTQTHFPQLCSCRLCQHFFPRHNSQHRGKNPYWNPYWDENAGSGSTWILSCPKKESLGCFSAEDLAYNPTPACRHSPVVPQHFPLTSEVPCRIYILAVSFYSC